MEKCIFWASFQTSLLILSNNLKRENILSTVLRFDFSVCFPSTGGRDKRFDASDLNYYKLALAPETTLSQNFPLSLCSEVLLNEPVLLKQLQFIERMNMFQLTSFSFLVRIFIGQVPMKLNVTHGKYADLKQVEGEILAMVSVRAGVVMVLLVQLGQAATRLSGLG